MQDRYDLVCVGMALVDSIIKGFDPKPISASGYRAASGSLNVGGEAVNEAIAAARLGLRTAILCALGKDAAGELVTDTLRRSGVDTGLIVYDRDHQTPVTTMFVNEDGSRQSITNGAHRHNFHPERYRERFTCAGAMILGSLFRAPFDDADVIREVLHAAKDRGMLTVADTKLPNFRFLTLEDLRDVLPLIDFITPNEDEARYYTGKDSPQEMADVLLDCGVGSVIIKLGNKGCYFKNREREIRLPACSIHAVDATGAGDNFVAGFTSELLRGMDVEEALRFGNACGAICTTAVGAGTALRNRKQVLELLKAEAERLESGRN